jgi:hypothetical protein
MDSNKKQELEKLELEQILSSKLFSRAPSLVNFLNYICQKYFEGNSNQIREFNIATEAFGRAPDFQQREDPIVRVEANRLRKRLTQYYETEGALHQVRMTIPPGQYAPLFLHSPETTDEGAPILSESAESRSIPQEASSSQGGAPPLPAETGKQSSDYFALAPWAIDEVVTSSAQSGADFSPPHPPFPANYEKRIIGRTPALRKYWWIGPVVLILLLAGILGYRSFRPAPTPGGRLQSRAASPAEVTVPLMSGPEDSIRILAGSTLTQYVDYLGHVWQGDRFFSGGTAVHFPNLWIAITQDAEIYRSAREGDFSYDIPLKPGTYELRLHFSENTYGPDTPEGGGESSRLITVAASGKKLLDQFDILADAGGGKTADIKVFQNITPVNGALHLAFSAVKVKGIVSGIEIIPTSAGRPSPIRITTRITAHFSKDQKLWEVDRYFRGGRPVQRNIAIQNTDDPELFQTERFGNFSYVIPVSPGKYSLSVYFVESGPARASSSGQEPDKRLFNVFCNGETLLKNFDVAKEAGGENRALIKHFSGLQPNAQDKIILNFVPVSRYATVSAIEVLPED